LRYEPIKNMAIEHLKGERDYGEKLAYIMYVSRAYTKRNI